MYHTDININQCLVYVASPIYSASFEAKLWAWPISSKKSDLNSHTPYETPMETPMLKTMRFGTRCASAADKAIEICPLEMSTCKSFLIPIQFNPSTKVIEVPFFWGCQIYNL